ncbi:MAG: hypothetical protein H6825_08130 [Planctomycetes bacterium]|nr:hypothetical protein [Planctomycetota bacterium]
MATLLDPLPSTRARTHGPRRLRVVPLATLVATLLAVVVGCASTEEVGTAFLHPNADLSLVRRVAVLPLENMTSDRFAGDRVREILAVELLAQGLFDVVDAGEVNRVLRTRNIENVAALGPEAVRSLGEDLGVQALLLGSVMEYRERRSGTFTAPEIALSLRLVDVETGIAMWSVSGAHSGLDAMTRLFGTGEKSFTQVARDLVRHLLDSLYGASFP